MSLKTGRELLNSDNIPNVRLAKDGSGRWVLFDGHHSLLAYLFTGKKNLHDIPHMIIVNEKTGHVSDEEIGAFFGEHAAGFANGEWFEHVINWQAPKSRQLRQRKQKNMGELYGAMAGSQEKTA
ncbi:hypothetical protein ACFL5V_06480 [Fibrobacterota bacterium]